MMKVAFVFCLMLIASVAVGQSERYVYNIEEGFAISPDGHPDVLSMWIWDTEAGEYPTDLSPVLLINLPDTPGLAYCGQGVDFYVAEYQGNGQYDFVIDFAGGVDHRVSGMTPTMNALLTIGANPDQIQDNIAFKIATPDLSGDLEVDLTDIVMFSGFQPTYHSITDYNRNDSFDVGDISYFTNRIGAACSTPAKGMTSAEMETLLDKTGTEESASWGTIKSQYR